MAITKCTHCSYEPVSEDAERCPHCGGSGPALINERRTKGFRQSDMIAGGVTLIALIEILRFFTGR